MKNMLTSLKSAANEKPQEFWGSVFLVAVITVSFYISITIFA